MLRKGTIYHINNNYLASLGYAYVPNFTFDKERMESAQVFENRYRLEQRRLTLIADSILS